MSKDKSQDRQRRNDPVREVVIAVAVVVGAVLALFIVPIALPALLVRRLGPHLASKASFWVVGRWHWVWNVLGVVAILALLIFEATQLRAFVVDGGWDAMLAADDPWAVAAATFLPWAVVNLAAGFLLLPVVWTVYRRRIAWLVWKRRHPDVIEAEKIAAARKRAADLATARAIGVDVNAKTGEIVRVSPSATVAPHVVTETVPGDPTKGEPRMKDVQRCAFGVVNRATVKTVPELFADVRRVRQWTDAAGRYAVMPLSAEHVRALIIAEAGTGKTFLVAAMILTMLEQGWPVTFLDAKGDPADAEKIAAIVRSYGHTAAIPDKWDFWSGTAAQIRTKLMRLLPKPDGANQHYLSEASGALQAIQEHSPIRSFYDLRHRLLNPEAYCRDQHDVDKLRREVDKFGTTTGQRVLDDIAQAYRPLEPFIDADGWSYDRRPAQLTIVPISPVDEAHAKVGELMLVDLRAFIARRLKEGDKSPGVAVIDEFPQLITDGSDPGDQVASLYETMRSSGYGLVLIAQSYTGISRSEDSRKRVMNSGAALIVGRSKDADDVVRLAGTYMQLEASGDPNVRDGLGGGRAQHTYVIPPQEVREANDGAFWLIQAGGFAHLRGLPMRPRSAPPAQVTAAVDATT